VKAAAGRWLKLSSAVVEFSACIYKFCGACARKSKKIAYKDQFRKRSLSELYTSSTFDIQEGTIVVCIYSLTQTSPRNSALLEIT